MKEGCREENEKGESEGKGGEKWGKESKGEDLLHCFGDGPGAATHSKTEEARGG